MEEAGARARPGLFTEDDVRLVLALNMAVAGALARAAYVTRAQGHRETNPRVLTWTVDLGASGKRRVQVLMMREEE